MANKSALGPDSFPTGSERPATPKGPGSPGPGDSSDSGPDIADAGADGRRQQVAEAAYYRAERRGFAAGSEDEDWLEAEREIDSERKERRSQAL